MENFNLKKYLAEGVLLKEDKDIDDLIRQGLEIQNKNQNSKNNWVDLDWDFSDSDSVDFGKFEVGIEQFQNFNGNYVIDSDGKKRPITQDIVDSILDSYQENYEDLSLTEYPNVHFVGDALSARGITVSGAHGTYVAEAILKEE